MTAEAGEAEEVTQASLVCILEETSNMAII